MKLFIDTSSLAKIYTAEKDHDKVLGLLENADTLIISPTTEIELYAALHRKLRYKELKQNEVEKAFKKFTSDKDHYFIYVVDWNIDLMEIVKKIIEEHDVKTLDAIQLASAIHSQSAKMITSDKKMHQCSVKIFKNDAIFV